MNHRCTHPTGQATQAAQRGVTLVESLIVLAVAAVTLGAAVPGFESARERRHLEGAAAQLETDLHFARSLAAAHHEALRVSFTNGADGSGYVIHHGSARHCRAEPGGTASCNGPARVHRVVHFAPGDAVGVQANVSSILFDPLKGTSTPTGTLRVVGRSGAAVHQVVNLMGRVRSCTPTPTLFGYPRC
ncbi:MAG: GspH/FimT family pseudopilin [Rubrivivax sp.]|nr:GspH/FimT family pseudopilin [Rubrivivax sp.]